MNAKLHRFRKATLEDVDDIIDLIIEINRKVGAVYGIPMDAESVVETVMHVVKRGICVVGPGACAGGMVHPYLWNRDFQMGTVIFWNYNRPSGVHVIEALAREFKQAGATHLTCTSHFPENKAGRIYVRMGSTPCEIQYIAKLANMKSLITPRAQPQEVAWAH